MINRIVFFNIGWMDFYKGLSNDKISGGGKYVDIMGWGGEMLNYKLFNQRMFGYVQPKINKKSNKLSTIKLENLGGTKDDLKLNNVTVVWTAKDPHNGGTYIIGWYKNATVYRYYQPPPPNSNRRFKNKPLGYFTFTKSNDAELLHVDRRILQVTRRKKNWMGQSNVWYANKNPKFLNIVSDYIFKGKLPKVRVKKGKGRARQSDPLKRIEIEKKAVLFVTKYYKKQGYKIKSFEKDNVGWDLTAINHKTQLKLEVKGLSGQNIATELTPNEYKNLKADESFYRLCIVTNTLIKPKLKIFSHSKDNNQWTSEDGTVINFQKVESARIYV